MSIINAIQDDYPSFISEELVDDWIASCHSHLIQIRGTILRLFIPSILAASIFAWFMGALLGGADPMGFAGAFVLVFFLIMIAPFGISANTLSYYIKFRSRELLGAWIGIFTCECDGKWIKALDKEELAESKGMEGKFVAKCPACKKAVNSPRNRGRIGKIMREMQSRDAIPRASGDELETCGNCKLGMNHQVKCRGCNRPLYLEKLYKRRLRDVDAETIKARLARFAKAQDPALKKGDEIGGPGEEIDPSRKRMRISSSVSRTA